MSNLETQVAAILEIMVNATVKEISKVTAENTERSEGKVRWSIEDHGLVQRVRVTVTFLLFVFLLLALHRRQLIIEIEELAVHGSCVLPRHVHLCHIYAMLIRLRSK